MSPKTADQLLSPLEPSVEKTQRPSKSDIVEVCKRLDLSEGAIKDIAAKASDVYNRVIAIGWFGNIPQEAMTAACVYVASRMLGNEDKGLETKIVSIVGEENMRDLRDEYVVALKAREELETRTRSAASEANRAPSEDDYLQYCEQLDLKPQTAFVSSYLGGKMVDNEWTGAHRDEALTAAYIFAASCFMRGGVDPQRDPAKLDRLLALTMIKDGRNVEAKDRTEFWNAYASLWTKRHELHTSKLGWSERFAERLPKPPSSSLKACS